MNRNNWETPWPVVKWCEAHLLNGRRFELDVCASAENKKAPHFFDESDNGLANQWFGNVWCNPPYGKGLIEPWVCSAVEHYLEYGIRTVMLLPVRTDMRWFRMLTQQSLIVFVQGRLNFIPPPGVKATSNFERSMFACIDGRRGFEFVDAEDLLE